MKTKEIDVWVDNCWLDCLNGVGAIVRDIGFNQTINGEDCTKAKPVIKIPEKKNEITESQLIQALSKSYSKKEGGFVNGVLKELGFIE